MPKIEPAVTTLWYTVADGTSYIDLAKDLSMINRRLYRQGMVYAVQDIQVGLASGMRTTDVWQGTVSVVPNTWATHNAWKKAFRTWRTMQDEYADGQGELLKGKWADFKVYLDDSQAGGTTLTPIDGNGDAVLTGEWIYSNFVYDDAGTARSPSMHMLGTSTDDSAIGLIEAYGDARNFAAAETPSNPSEMTTGFYAQFHGIGDIDDELGADLRDDNDAPPYDRDDYYGGDANGDHAHPIQIISCSGTQSVTRAPGFIAPCGLIKIETNELATTSVDPNTSPAHVYGTATAATAVVGFTVAVGPYRGVLATPMGQ